MADRPRRDPRDRSGSDEPDFDWLYGGRRQQGGEEPHDPEPTMRLPTVGREGAAGGAYGGTGSSADDEPTQRIAASRARPSDRPYQSPAPSSRSARPSGPPPSARPRPVAPPPGPSRGSGSRRFRPRPRWLLVLLVAWVVFLVVVPLIAWQHVAHVAATPVHSRPADQPGTTYLLVGSDSRQGLTAAQKHKLATGNGEGSRTDTIMLLHTGHGPNMLMSIPRDSLVPVPGHGTTKINSAFAYGGPRLLERTIEDNTGIRIDDYVEIGFAGFVDVVDAVGGITVCPKHRMDDYRANLHIKAGCQHVGGTTALGYARSRHSQQLGDIGRAQHQREVVSAVAKKAASPWSVINPVRYVRLNMAAAKSLRLGKGTGLLATGRFAFAMTRVNGSNGLTCGVPISDLAVHWDPQRSKRMFSLIAHDRTDEIPSKLCTPSGLPHG